VLQEALKFLCGGQTERNDLCLYGVVHWAA